MKYTQRHDGEGFEVQNKQIFKLECCDCGLVHQVVIASDRLKDKEPIGFAAKRDNRATAQRRRKKK